MLWRGNVAPADCQTGDVPLDSCSGSVGKIQLCGATLVSYKSELVSASAKGKNINIHGLPFIGRH